MMTDCKEVNKWVVTCRVRDDVQFAIYENMNDVFLRVKYEVIF